MNVDSAKAGMVNSRKKFCLKHEYYTIPYVSNSIVEIDFCSGETVSPVVFDNVRKEQQ